jgi:hypothetical protein
LYLGSSDQPSLPLPLTPAGCFPIHKLLRCVQWNIQTHTHPHGLIFN